MTPGAPRFPVERFELPSGLRLVVQPDARWPLVAVRVSYDAGSRYDPPGRAGLAHLCEHLAFDGAGESRPTFAERIERVGGVARAATTADTLTFSALAPTEALAALLDIEAERMTEPVDRHDDAALATARRVVATELQERSMTRARAVALEQVHRLLYPASHPYHRPASGDLAGVRATTAADVSAFVASRLRPELATMVIAGDVPADRARSLVARAFESAGSARADAWLARGSQPTVDADAFVDRDGGDVRTRHIAAPIGAPQTFIAWIVDGVGRPGWYLASLLLRAVAAGRSSPMARTLIAGDGVAQDVRGVLVSMRHASTLVFTATATAGLDAPRFERAVAGAVERALAAGLRSEDLDRARNKALSDHYFALQTLERRAERCATLADEIGEPQRLDREADRYLAPDLEALTAFAARLRDTTRAMLAFVPRTEAA